MVASVEDVSNDRGDGGWLDEGFSPQQLSLCGSVWEFMLL